MANEFIRMDVRDSTMIKFWTDVWHPKVRLIELLGEVGTQKLGIAREAKICDILVGGE